MKKILIILVAIVLLAVVAFAVVKRLPALNVTIPDYQEPGELVQAEQGWNASQQLAFHHTAQGTRLVPYAWFMALEQPCISLFECDAFSDSHYLLRFGFVASKRDPDLNPDGLPVGFALQRDFWDPNEKKTIPALGLTCSACHTSIMRYGKYDVQIDGAPANIEVTQFQKALGLSMLFTQVIPGRYGRFEKKVLGENATDAQKTELKQEFTDFMDAAKAELKATQARKIYDNQAGFARTDALTRIGNQVFAVDMKIDDNFAVANAPVRFPQIWDASWFNWVQYNSSIADPMVRNIGEALGVRAQIKLYGPTATDYDNSVHVEGIHTVETLLAGPAQYKGLNSPKWPSVFPPLDQAKVEKGAALYKQNCSGCHLPPPSELVADLNSPKPVHWWKNGEGKLYLKVTDIPVKEIGTDPHEAMDFIARTADTGDLKKGRVSADVGLDLVTKAIAAKYYDKAGFTPEKRLEWNGFHDPNDPAVRAPAVYKARPLNGVWALGQYLHNGSVPSIYQLLGPVSERPAKFWTGNKLFDPVKVGRDTSELKGGYLFDTANPGNSNVGHEFRDGPKGNGVIGPSLSPDDRWAIIEYLKSL